MPPKKHNKRRKGQRDYSLPLCRDGIHNLGPLDEIGVNGIYEIGKLCSACSYILYKDELLLQKEDETRRRKVFLKTQIPKSYIDLFHEELTWEAPLDLP